MPNLFQLDIVLPETPMPSRSIASIDVPAADGRLTVLANHQPLITVLIPGDVQITDENGSREHWIISSGALQVDNNVATLLVREATQKTRGASHENSLE
jgi:F-type H+-transporting ATPase subunit epsilon